jgi:hypothetical protein
LQIGSSCRPISVSRRSRFASFRQIVRRPFDRGAIPWRSIDAYAARYGLVGDDFDRFARVIRAMDAAYLDYLKKPED